MPESKSKPKRAKKKPQRKAPEKPADAVSHDVWEGVKYFKPYEFTCNCENMCDHAVVISPPLVAKLDKIRDVIGMPIHILSGTRCENHNRKVGGKRYSSHLAKKGTSHAVDIYCPDSAFRYAFLTVALPMFNRIGIGKDFIHADDDPDLPPNVIWLY